MPTRLVPGDYLYSRHGQIAKEVNSRLKKIVVKTLTPYKVKVDIKDLNIRTGPGTNYSKTGKTTGEGTFTIISESSGKGSTKGWGKLKSGVGWISLDYANKI